MVKFGTITQKTIRVEYTKDDVQGYVVSGSATYNKENKLSDAHGEIRDAEGNRIANFNTYGEGENTRINLTDCLAGMISPAVVVAEATLADLANSNPEV